MSDKKLQRDIKRTQESIEIIIEESERLTRLINDVLDLAKIESGKMEWKTCEVSILEVVQNSINANSSLARDKGLEMKIKTRGDNFQFSGDPDRLTQIVTNLLSNAIKFTQDGTITCELKHSGNFIAVKVIDTSS